MAESGPILLGVDFDARGLRDVFRAAPRKAARLTRNVLRKNSLLVATEARQILTRIQNPKLHPKPEGAQRGGLAQSIIPTPVQMTGSQMFAEVTWGGLPYGYILEHGPTKKDWDIRPKYYKALRFGWPNAPMGGFTLTVAGKAKSGERIGALTENVFYFKRVHRRWSRKELRPHIRPAMRKVEPLFLKDMEGVIREVMR